LGIDPTDDPDAIRAAYRRLAREYHPDQLIARGLPQEAVTLAERKMAQINDAYDYLSKGR
jgi:DnaJ like chaperone protein